jgi:DNA-binding transcriptional MerR regulator
MTVILCILTGMKEKEHLFTLDELAGLVDLPRRTVRYYIQIELIDRPEGVGRGAHYTRRHLEQLIEVRKWQQAGLSLERIRELLTSDASEDRLPPLRPREKGSVQVKSHVMIDEGVELTIDTTRSSLTPERVRKFADEVMNLYEIILNSEEL